MESAEVNVLIPEEKQTKKQRRKKKRLERQMKRYFDPNDIAYRGPLSYRYLRIIAWVAMALGQLVNADSVAILLTEKSMIGTFWSWVLPFVANLSLPLFLIASFSIILNKQKTYKSYLITYGSLYLTIGFVFWVILTRYVTSAINAFLEPGSTISGFMGDSFGPKIEINIFADLFVLSAFNFFLNYDPVNKFQGKNLKYFRMMMIIPIFFMVLSYTIKVLALYDTISLPIQVYPFLTTKTPVMHLVFILICLYFKFDKKNYVRLGGKIEEYDDYLKTNKHSFAFSKRVSFLFFIFSLIDFLTLIVMLLIVYGNPEAPALINHLIDGLGIGSCSSLFLGIPLIMLFSYTRTHKNNSLDIIIPIIGIAMCALAYLEVVRYVLVYLASNPAQ